MLASYCVCGVEWTLPCRYAVLKWFLKYSWNRYIRQSPRVWLLLNHLIWITEMHLKWGKRSIFLFWCSTHIIFYFKSKTKFGINWTTSRFKMSEIQSVPSRKWKYKPKTGRKYFQLLYLIMDFHINNSHGLILKRQMTKECTDV